MGRDDYKPVLVLSCVWVISLAVMLLAMWVNR